MRTRTVNSLSSARTVTSLASPPSTPVIENSSSPVSPSDSAFSPSANCSGSTPMPTRFERWMRSKDSAITARTPSRFVPLAAQSRDEPEPYSLPASTISGVSFSAYFIAAS